MAGGQWLEIRNYLKNRLVLSASTCCWLRFIDSRLRGNDELKAGMTGQPWPVAGGQWLEIRNYLKNRLVLSASICCWLRFIDSRLRGNDGLKAGMTGWVLHRVCWVSLQVLR